MLMAVGIGLYFFCENNRSVNHCKILHDHIMSLEPVLNPVKEKANAYAGEAVIIANEWFLVAKVEFSKMVDQLFVFYDNWLSRNITSD